MIARTADGAMTLPGEFYTAESIFREERERIFSKMWLYAGHVSQLPEPGSFFEAKLDGESVLVVRDREGAVGAFFNLCRHRGSRLCSEQQGRFTGGIQCPYQAVLPELQRVLPLPERAPSAEQADAVPRQCHRPARRAVSRWVR